MVFELWASQVVWSDLANSLISQQLCQSFKKLSRSRFSLKRSHERSAFYELKICTHFCGRIWKIWIFLIRSQWLNCWTWTKWNLIFWKKHWNWQRKSRWKTEEKIQNKNSKSQLAEFIKSSISPLPCWYYWNQKHRITKSKVPLLKSNSPKHHS